VIAVGALGSRLGLVDRELESQIVLLAVVTATVCPTIFRLLAPPLRPATVASTDEPGYSELLETSTARPPR
jgi:hypothetical protein